MCKQLVVYTFTKKGYSQEQHIEGNLLIPFFPGKEEPSGVERNFFPQRNTMRLKTTRSAGFWPCFWLVRFDLHINETGLYKPRFFQICHSKSSSLGEALSVWLVFFPWEVFYCCSTVVFTTKSSSSRSLSVLFRTTFSEDNCSSHNNFLKSVIQVFFSEQLFRIVVWNYILLLSFVLFCLPGKHLLICHFCCIPSECLLRVLWVFPPFSQH